jgi:hypothetical protein
LFCSGAKSFSSKEKSFCPREKSFFSGGNSFFSRDKIFCPGEISFFLLGKPFFLQEKPGGFAEKPINGRFCSFKGQEAAGDRRSPKRRHAGGWSFAGVPMPAGMKDNSPRFQPWVKCRKSIKPRRGGRMRFIRRTNLSPLPGLGSLLIPIPAVETAGYFRSPLGGCER